MDSEAFDNGTVPLSNEDGDQACKHDFKLDEQIGIICQLCNYVHTKIRDVMPQFVSPCRGTSFFKMFVSILE